MTATIGSVLKRDLGDTIYGLLCQPSPPDNIRGLVLRKTGIPIPEKENPRSWLEANYETAKAARPAPAVAKQTPLYYTVSGGYHRREYGSCDYANDASYAGELRVPERVIREIVEENEGDLDNMVEYLKQYVRDNESFENNGDDYSYNNYEQIGSDSREDEEYNAAEVLDAFLAEHGNEFDAEGNRIE